MIDVPVAAALDTEIDLERTGRRPGDRVALRASLVDEGEIVGEPYEMGLAVDWLGWHARLDPSVVLARPDSGLAGEANFRFGTAVSWLWSYEPRPLSRSFFDGFFRATDFSVGPHAAILPFNQDKEVEIGLGLTAAVWNGILQAGIGWNLMSDDDDSSLYYFVGSSLIPLVQAVGDALPANTTNSVTR